MTQAKNTICLWYDKDAEEAANFYAATFPDSEVTAVHKAPGDYPGGKGGALAGIGVGREEYPGIVCVILAARYEKHGLARANYCRSFDLSRQGVH